VPFLVLDTLLEYQDRRGFAFEDLNRIGQVSQIEVSGVSAPKKVNKIGSRQQQTPGEDLHG
jgi:hypothetical protein